MPRSKNPKVPADGTMTLIDTKMILKCPFAIMMVPEHYREDGSCLCDDADHRKNVMIKQWGYKAKDFKDIPLRES